MEADGNFSIHPSRRRCLSQGTSTGGGDGAEGGGAEGGGECEVIVASFTHSQRTTIRYVYA